MAEACPVCGDPFEYHEVVSVDGAGDRAGTSVDVDTLCSSDPETRWNRICPVASPDDGEVRLDVYRHHWGSTE